MNGIMELYNLLEIVTLVNKLFVGVSLVFV